MFLRTFYDDEAILRRIRVIRTGYSLFIEQTAKKFLFTKKHNCVIGTKIDSNSLIQIYLLVNSPA